MREVMGLHQFIEVPRRNLSRGRAKLGGTLPQVEMTFDGDAAAIHTCTLGASMAC